MEDDDDDDEEEEDNSYLMIFHGQDEDFQLQILIDLDSLLLSEINNDDSISF